jgi:penicillin-binding protein 1C
MSRQLHLGFIASKRVQRATGVVLAVAVLPLLLFGGLSVLFPLPVDQLHPSSSTVVQAEDGTLLRAFLADDEMWRLRVEEDAIAPVMKQAVVGYEDQRFYHHPGIDPIAIGRAVVANVRAGRVVQGGSTITMQVARMMEPKARTVPNKVIEAFRALQLEWRYSKAEILEHYFNLAPYGGNLVGVEAAARLYFDKPAASLSLGEAALLAAIPNDPNANRPDEHVTAARAARDKVLRLLHERGVITGEDRRQARAEPLPQRRYALPFDAPHLADHLAARYAHADRLETTVDARLQRMAARMLAAHVQGWRSQGITNGAVVVIENATMAVRALVGSADFFDMRNEGQVNGALAPRSPGSALKPFVYAKALDQGLVGSHTLLQDIPVDYNGYAPENYDRTYSGVVPVREALARSLNVPAVNLSADLGPDAMYHFFRRGGLRTLNEPAHHYGLSLILGGGEVTLLDLTTLYATLANGGTYRPYRLLADDPEGQPIRLLSDGASYIVTEMLSDLRRPDLPAVWEWSRDQPTVAWKTGTSYGHRDAWSIGVTPRYTVGVWVGNMDAAGASALVGAEVAAPLLFQLMQRLERDVSARWFIQPAAVATRRVCTVSGQPATRRCPSTRSELYLPGRTPAQPCDLHQTIWVDDDTGHRLCSHCRQGRSHEPQVVTRWPSGVATWLERTGYPVDAIPQHLPSCRRVAEGDPPVIRSPQPGTSYRLRSGVPAEYQRILLEASVSNETDEIYWFVDGEMLYQGNPGERVFFTPERGEHTLLCMDDEGRSSEVQITVR